MKKFTFLAFIIVIAVLVALLYKNLKAPIKVAYIAKLSGEMSENGIAGRNGARLAVKVINESGGVKGRPIELIVMDNEGKIETGIKKTKMLIDSLKVPVIFGHMLSFMAPAIIPFKDSNVLFVSPLMSTSKLSIKDDNFIRFNEPTSHQANLIINLISKKNEWKKVITVYDKRNLLYSQSIIHFVDSAVNNMDEKEIVKGFYIETGKLEEFNNLAKSIMENEPDVIILTLNGMNFATAAQSIRSIGIKSQLIASRWASSNDMLQFGGKSVEGAILTENLILEKKSNAYEEFINRYKENFGGDPHFISRFAYETVFNTLSIMRETENLQPLTIRDAMINRKSYKGLIKEITIDSLGDGHRGLSLVKVINGKLEPFNE